MVPTRQGAALVTLFVLGNTSIFGLGARAGTDLWLAFLTAIVLSLPFILLYSRLRTLLPGADLWEGLEQLLGLWPSRLVALFYAFYAWRLACFVGQDVASFLTGIPLENTPNVVLLLFAAVLSLWAVKAGLEVLARWSGIFFKIVLFIISITFFLVLTQVDLENLRPVLYHGFEPVILGALELVDFPFLETVLLFWVFDTFGEKGSVYKIMVPGFLLAAFILMITSTTALTVEGVDKYVGSFFPGYVAVSRIDIARFLTRLEILAGVYFVIGGFLKLSICLLTASKGFARGLGFRDYRFLVTPLALGLIAGSQWFAKSLLETHVAAIKIWHPYDASIQMVIPFLLWLLAEIKFRPKASGHQ